jgi:hypothetical protein
MSDGGARRYRPLVTDNGPAVTTEVQGGAPRRHGPSTAPAPNRRAPPRHRPTIGGRPDRRPSFRDPRSAGLSTSSRLRPRFPEAAARGRGASLGAALVAMARRCPRVAPSTPRTPISTMRARPLAAAVARFSLGRGRRCLRRFRDGDEAAEGHVRAAATRRRPEPGRKTSARPMPTAKPGPELVVTAESLVGRSNANASSDLDGRRRRRGGGGAGRRRTS